MLIGLQLCLHIMAFRRSHVLSPTPGAYQTHAPSCTMACALSFYFICFACSGMTSIAGKALSAYLWTGHMLLKGLLSPILLALAWCDVWKGKLLRLFVYNLICLLVYWMVQVRSVFRTSPTSPLLQPTRLL